MKGLPKMNMNSGYMAGEAFGRGKAHLSFGLARAGQECDGCFWSQTEEGDEGSWCVFCGVPVEWKKPALREDDCRSVECGSGRRNLMAGKKAIFKSMQCPHHGRWIQMWFR